MKLFALAISFAALLASLPAQAADVSVDLHLRFGDPVSPPVRIVEPPLFLYPPGLGFYVAVGVPYPYCYIDGFYYLNKGDRWYIAAHYGGPWYHLKRRHLPPGLASHSLKDIIKHRDLEHSAYKKKPGSYGGNVFQPGQAGPGEKPVKPGKGKGKWK